MANRSNAKSRYRRKNNSKGNAKQSPANGNLMNSNKHANMQEALDKLDGMRSNKNQSKKA